MAKYNLSILIPARNEMFTARTVQDIIEKKRGNTEIIVGMDGAWSDPGVEDHPDVKILYVPEAIGQRAMTNRLARLSKSKYVMKVDAHCSFDEGFDSKLMADMQDDWTVAPTMKNLHAFDWVCPEGHRRYQGPSGPCMECGKETTRDVIWYAKPSPNSTSYRFDKTLKFQYFGEYKAKQDRELGESMSLQGSCFMLTRDKYWELNICDEEAGSWGHQGSEVALKTWLSGGRVIINQKTWYAHMFRTQGGDFGFPWPAREGEIEKARKHFRNIFLEDKWPLAKHKLSWLVDKFSPVPDWEDVNSPTKGIIYYTDNQLDLKIMKACQDQLKKAGLPITSSALRKIDFGDKRIRFPTLKRGPYAIFKEMLGAMENSPFNIVFFCEHDVLYPPSHFDFVPEKKDVFYFNTNVWKVDAATGKAVRVDKMEQVSGMCAWKELALGWVRNKMKQIEENGFDRHYEPRGKRENWSSKEPLVDIRHNKNTTPNRWSKDQFRNPDNTKGWTEGKCPDWARDIVSEMSEEDIKYDVSQNAIEGWMSDIDLLWLFNTAKEMDSVVEIGSWKGRSTHALLSGCKGTVYAVDHFLGSAEERSSGHSEAQTRDIHKDFMNNVGGFQNLKVLKMDNSEAVKQFKDESVDMIFIDAGHSYAEVLADIKRWLPKTKKIICGHDYDWPEVEKAVKEAFGKEFEINGEKNMWFKRISPAT